MTTVPNIAVPTRRNAIRGGAAAALASLGGGRPLFAGERRGATARDRFWLWGHPAGAHDKGWGLPGTSRITPVEAAYYMSIPNAVMVRYEGKPDLPFDQYAVPFRALRQVVWSAVGAGGATDARERSAVLALARNSRNFSGVQMDDFFLGEPKDGKVAALSIPELRQLRDELRGGPRKLGLWVTLYTHQLNDSIKEHLKYCDDVTLWTWKAQDLNRLAANLEKARSLAPDSRLILGCYMWDYGTHKPMPAGAMQHQAELGLKWLQAGQIDGIIFLASCICDLGLETVEWTREWIGRNGARAVPGLREAGHV
jgi:hypothetical protein